MLSSEEKESGSEKERSSNLKVLLMPDILHPLTNMVPVTTGEVGIALPHFRWKIIIIRLSCVVQDHPAPKGYN